MESNNINSLPTVSVVIPVYNDPQGLENCLSALQQQTYKDECFDVIVADNGSTDNTREIAEQYNVEVVVEDEIQSSYAARNKGIRTSLGEYIAFTDADCQPNKNWVTELVTTCKKKDADLVSGRIKFNFSHKKTAAEQFDALIAMRNDRRILENQAVTANILVDRHVFCDIGLFPTNIQSGGDLHWTSKATSSGYSLVYNPDAVVEHAARQFCERTSKMYRVGKGGIISQTKSKSKNKFNLKDILHGISLYIKKVYLFITKKGTYSKSHGHPDRDFDFTLSLLLVAIWMQFIFIIGRFSRYLDMAFAKFR